MGSCSGVKMPVGCKQCCAVLQFLLTGVSLQMMRVDLVKYNKRYGFAKMRGTCHVGPNLVCEADLNLVMGK